MVKKVLIRPKAFAEKDNDEESLREYMKRTADEAFVENLPMDALKELPSWYKYAFGMIGYMIALGTMLYFTYTLFQQQTNKSFIALSYDDGDCEPVPTIMTGDFIASYRGMWEGQRGFVYSEALYSMTLTGYEGSMEDYVNKLNGIEKQLQIVADGAVHRDAGENLLYWMTWSVNVGLDYFEMTGDPTSILNREYFYGTLAGIAGECQAEPEARFTVATAEMELFFQKDRFDQLEYCTAAATPAWMGWVERFMKNNFIIKIDAWQAMVAIAVNLGEMQMNLLQPVQGTEKVLHFHNETLYLVEVFDFRYPGMLPLSCISTDQNLRNMRFRACLLRQGDTYMLPVMNHFGTARDFPEPCNCSNGDFHNRECHNLDLMVSVLFYNLPPYDTDIVNNSQPQAANNSLYALLTLLESDTYRNINRNAYNISFAACRFNQWTDPVWRNTSYEFCNLAEYGTCSMIMYNPYDRRSRTVSPFYYQVPSIACADSFMTPNWAALTNTPPAPLHERYLQCTVPWYEAIFEAQGIASGNAALAVPLIMGGLLPFLFLYMQQTGNNPPKPEYSEEELTNASRAHALYMLRVRDKKTRGFVQNSVLMQTARELMNVSGQEVAFSDSDDESDEEQEEGVDDEEESHDEEKDAGWRGPVATAIRTRLNKNRHSSEQGVELSHQLKPTITPGLTRIRGVIVLNGFKHLSSKFSRRRRLHDCVTLTDLKGVLEKLNDLFEKALSVRGRNGSGASFRNALHEALYLKNVKLDEIYAGQSKEDARECFKILQQVMRMHASLEFDRALQGITAAVGKYAAYNLGGRVLTMENVMDVAVLNSSPFVLGFDAPK
mmetsp:Transcript_32611/g.60933  ORF Transcript_32611/g.60933 Transcript_32611/m.60933 type:complete len:833 (+) Transcript_32611:136-2634(+)